MRVVCGAHRRPGLAEAGSHTCITKEVFELAATADHDQVAVVTAQELKDARALPATKRHDPADELAADAVIDAELGSSRPRTGGAAAGSQSGRRPSRRPARRRYPRQRAARRAPKLHPIDDPGRARDELTVTVGPLLGRRLDALSVDGLPVVLVDVDHRQAQQPSKLVATASSCPIPHIRSPQRASSREPKCCSGRSLLPPQMRRPQPAPHD